MVSIDPALLAVWWLRPAAIKQLVAHSEDTRDLWRLLHVPEYIGLELHSAAGRNGRGRLWPAGRIDCDDLAFPDDHPNAAYCLEAAGIVYWRRDLTGCCGLPGLGTDWQLNTLPEWERTDEDADR